METNRETTYKHIVVSSSVITFMPEALLKNILNVMIPGSDLMKLYRNPSEVTVLLSEDS